MREYEDLGLDAEWAEIAQAETEKYLDDENRAIDRMWPEVDRFARLIQALQGNYESGKIDRWEFLRILKQYDLEALPLIIDPEDLKYFQE